MEHSSPEAPEPATSYTRVREDGSAYLEGSKCRACGAGFVGARENCARCGVRGFMERYALSEYGRLYNYTIVYRSYPGIAVPFVSAVVDLDDGTSVKGNLLGVEPASKRACLRNAGKDGISRRRNGQRRRAWLSCPFLCSCLRD